MGLECAEGSYLSRVGCEMQHPAWASDVGLPMIATILGLAIAVVLVRSQISSDRRLRHADRVSPEVATFGWEVITAVDRPNETAGSDSYWDEPSWDGHVAIRRAREKLAVTLAQPNVFEEVVRRSEDISAAWNACFQRRRQLAARGITLSTVDVGLGIDAACSALWHDLREAGNELTRWDGLTEFPTIGLGRHLHVPRAGPQSSTHKQEARQRWLAYYADEFERVALEWHERSE